MNIPTSSECFYIIEMLEAELIDSTYVIPWSEEVIATNELVPQWLRDISWQRQKDDELRTLREFVQSANDIVVPKGLDKFHVGCLYLRYERRELSFASFLRMTGDYVDQRPGHWSRGLPDMYWDLTAESYFSENAETSLREEYVRKQSLEPWIALARQQFAPFDELRKANKTLLRTIRLGVVEPRS